MAGATRIPGPIGVEPQLEKSIDPGTSARIAMPAPASSSTKPKEPPPTNQVLQLAATAYGEASSKDIADEINGIVRVLLRQARSRGYDDAATFIAKDKTFAFAAHDGNARYKALIKATPEQRAANAGMRAALAAAADAVAGVGLDTSGGAFFWDGADLKTNARHPKLLQGVQFTDKAHDIYGVGSKEVPGENWWLDAKGKRGKSRGTWKYTYDSTAAHGGTVFWKYNADFLKATGNKAYR